MYYRCPHPPGPVAGPGVVVAPDLGVSAVHGDGQQGVTSPQDPDKREHQHNHGLKTEEAYIVRLSVNRDKPLHQYYVKRKIYVFVFTPKMLNTRIGLENNQAGLT